MVDYFSDDTYFEWAELNSLLRFPADTARQLDLCKAYLAEAKYEQCRRSGASHVPRELVDEYADSLRYFRDHAEEIRRQEASGDRCGTVMEFLCTLKKSCDNIVAGGGVVQKGQEPSLRNAFRLTGELFSERERQTGVDLKPYSPTSLLAAWEEMRPVAHYWAAKSKIEREQHGQNYQAARAAWVSRLEGRAAETFDLFAFLQLAARYFVDASTILASRRNGPPEVLFDPDLAIWRGAQSHLADPIDFTLEPGTREEIDILLARNKEKADIAATAKWEKHHAAKS